MLGLTVSIHLSSLRWTFYETGRHGNGWFVHVKPVSSPHLKYLLYSMFRFRLFFPSACIVIISFFDCSFVFISDRDTKSIHTHLIGIDCHCIFASHLCVHVEQHLSFVAFASSDAFHIRQLAMRVSEMMRNYQIVGNWKWIGYTTKNSFDSFALHGLR